MSSSHPQYLRSASPVPTVNTSQEEEEGESISPLSTPFIFGATPSLRLDIPPTTAAHSLPFPSTRPHLERQNSNVSSITSSSLEGAPLQPPKPFSLPPGLASSPLPSTLDVTTSIKDQLRQARGAKISNEPPIPLEIQQLLLTTPPPPRRRHKSAITYPPPPTSPLENPKVESEKPTSLMGRIRALTLRTAGSREAEVDVIVQPRTATPRTEVLDLKRSRQKQQGLNEDLLSFHAPQNWKSYENLYAAGRFDVESPPRPPNENSPTSQAFPSTRSRAPPSFDAMTPYDLAHFPAPLHLSRLSPIRERLISNLDLLGTFLPDESTFLSPQFSPNFPAQHWSPSSPSFNSTSSPLSRQDPLVQSMSSPSSGSRTRGWSSASTAPSTILSSSKVSHFGNSPQMPYVQSIQSHTALETLLDRLIVSLEDLSLNAATITLFPTSPATTRLDVIASSGIASIWREIAVDVALDAHTILNGSKGLVVHDVEKDWRWRGNRDLEEKGVGFYAAMPFFAPSSLSLRTSDVAFSVAQFEEEAGGARIAIGVVSVMDERPKEKGAFGVPERARLRSIASEITSEIERFVLQRAAAIDALSSRRTSATSAATFQSGSIPTPALRSARSTNGSTRSPSSSQRSRTGKGHAKKVSFDANALPSNLPPPSQSLAPRISTPTFNEPDSIPALFQTHSPQKLLDLACSSLSRQLDLTLVYLVELDSLPPRSAYFGSTIPSLVLISSRGLPSSPSNNDDNANFDPSLHLQALRAPEGGLLYRAASTAEPFDSGMLLPVIEIEEKRKGWVIAGYAEQRGRRWGEEEMRIFENVTRGIEKILLWREAGMVR